MAFMAPILAENKPFLLTGYWSHQVLNKDAAQRWRSFAGIKSVLTEHGLEQLRVDVACTKKGEPFRGDQANRQHVSLRLVDLIELAEANDAGKPHWAAAEELGLDYYLCQCPVVSREEGKPEVLKAIAGEFRTPSCVLEEDLLQINLWLGAMATTTNLHYDANHNLLFVLKGRKRVALLPPSMAGTIQAMPVFSESANHSRLEGTEAAELVGSEEAMKKGAVYAEIGEGEGLFIPEGWWHQITSNPGTVAVNVWFKGVRPALCEGPSRHMREYYLRCLVESLLTDILKETADAYSTYDGSEQGDKLEGKSAGIKRPRTPPLHPQCPPAEQSPLLAPTSTVDERNSYLRIIGAARMREELPSIALTRAQEWARLVTGLDPLTVHVLTSQWQNAGGAESMPEFYQAIFGGGEVGSGTAGNHEGASSGVTAEGVSSAGGSRDRAVGGNGQQGAAGIGGGVGGISEIGVENMDGQLRSDGAEELGFERSFPGELDDGSPPQEQQHTRGVVGGRGGTGGSVGRAETYCGTALQERLVRLREAFAQEECRKLLTRAIGL